MDAVLLRPPRVWHTLLALAVCLAAAGCRKAQVSPGPAPADGGLTPITSPYPNTRPEVRYVGDQACVACHEKTCASFHQHPMGRSCATVAELIDHEKFDAKANNPFDLKVTRFSAERRGEHLFHQARNGPGGSKHQDDLDAEAEVVFAIGSGRQGRSYVINHEGFLFQSPVSWFSNPESWGLSPGFGEDAPRFSRPITNDCVFCHCNTAFPVADTVNHYDRPLACAQSIGCERCHGPGALHVQAHTDGPAPEPGADDTIVNPGKLEPVLRDAVCQQCHLQGKHRIVRRGRSLFDYRPGLPFHAFVAVFVQPPERVDSRKAISHVEQMHLSRCFRASRGKLGCVSCHDPHGLPAESERVRFYRGRCLACHQEASCSLPLEERRHKDPADSCISCHMPRGDSSNIAHMAITDHRVVRRPDKPPPAPYALRPGVPLAHFHETLVPAGDAETARDLALAMIEEARKPGPPQVRALIAERALGHLDEAVERHPDDVPAWLAKGRALRGLGRRPEALAALREALARAPQHEAVLEEASSTAAELGRLDLALDYGQRLLAVAPWQPRYHYDLASVRAQRREWPEALAACRAGLRLDAGSLPLRRLLVRCLAQSGDTAQARSEFEKVLALDPSNADELRRWFAELLR